MGTLICYLNDAWHSQGTSFYTSLVSYESSDVLIEPRNGKKEIGKVVTCYKATTIKTGFYKATASHELCSPGDCLA